MCRRPLMRKLTWRLWITCGLLLLPHFAGVRGADSQTTPAVPQGVTPYSLSVSVDEVSLSFHAADAHSLPVNDLKLDELSLLDNGKPPRKILAFGSLRDFPIRAGILMDTSESMEGFLARNRAIAIEYAQRLLRATDGPGLYDGFRFAIESDAALDRQYACADRGYSQFHCGREEPYRRYGYFRCNLSGVSESVRETGSHGQRELYPALLRWRR